MTEQQTKYDAKSRYYDIGGIEVIEIIRAKLTPEQYRGYLLGNVLKYACRMEHKGSADRDAEKMRMYAEWLSDVSSDDTREPCPATGRSCSTCAYDSAYPGRGECLGCGKYFANWQPAEDPPCDGCPHEMTESYDEPCISCIDPLEMAEDYVERMRRDVREPECEKSKNKRKPTASRVACQQDRSFAHGPIWPQEWRM